MPTFTPDVEGAYVLQLIVNDGGQNSLPDTLTIDAIDPEPPCLVFSEYLEGIGNNKAYEVYNCGTQSLALAPFHVCLVANDDTDCSGYLQLQGTLAAGDVYGVCHADLSADVADLNACDVPTSITSHVSGNDRLVLFRDDDGTTDLSAGDAIVDAFGETAVNPGEDAWKDVTMRRCDWSVPYDGTTPFPNVWTTHAADDFSNFGIAPNPGCP